MPDNGLSAGRNNVIVLLLKSSEKNSKSDLYFVRQDKEACLPCLSLVPFVNGVVVRECSSGNLCTAVSMSIRRNVGNIG